jgi:hypothetical protein
MKSDSGYACTMYNCKLYVTAVHSLSGEMKNPIIARNTLTTAAIESTVRIEELMLENKFSLSHLDTPANCTSGGLSRV